MCGFNNNTSYFCKKMRGSVEFAKENADDRATWKEAPSSCHHRSSIQFCKAIHEDPELSERFRNFLATEWITTDDNWPLIAKSNKCVTRAIRRTQVYWNIVDPNPDNAMYFSLSIGAIFITIVSFML